VIAFRFAGAKLNKPRRGGRISVSIQPCGSTMRLRRSVRAMLFWERVMTIRKRGFRALVLGLLVTAGLALAPSAFARGHVSIGINLPGLSIGVGSHHSYLGIGPGYGSYYGGYYGDYYGGGYYGPTYYSGYYAPAPVYYDSYYYAPVYRTHYRSSGYYRDYGRGYNDRGYRGGYDRGYSRGGYSHGGYSHGGYGHHGSSDPRYRH
jgi:hypothetical protein